MEKQTHFNFSLVSRVFVFSLCFLLLFCLVSRPITAHASATATVVLGLAGGATAPVSLPIAAVCLLVVAVVGVVGANLDTIIQTATSWYNESESLRNWANSVGTQLEEGTVVVIPPDVQRYLQKKANGNKVPDNMPILFVPQSFLSLDTLTQAELVGTDVSGLLGTSNKLLDKVNTRLIELKSNILLLPSLIENTLSSSLSSIISSTQTISSTVSQYSNMVQNSVEGITSTLNQQVNMLRSGVDTITSTFNQQSNMLRSAVDSIPTAFNQQFNMLRNAVDSIPTAFNQQLNMLRNSVDSFPSTFTQHMNMLRSGVESVTSSVKSTYNEVKTNISEKLDTISSKIVISTTGLELKLQELFAVGATTTPPNFKDPMNQAGNAENTLMNQAGGGSDITIHYIGEGKDLLSKYRVAFLAVGATLVKFFEIPVLSDLITFSLALGIFALVVNLTNTMLSKASDSSVKGKKSFAKGG